MALMIPKNMAHMVNSQTGSKAAKFSKLVDLPKYIYIFQKKPDYMSYKFYISTPPNTL